MTILGIGFFELLIIMVIALVVVGPERLPELLHTLGTWIRRARNIVEELRAQARAELGSDYDYVEEQVRTLRELNPRRQIQDLAASLLQEPPPAGASIRPPRPAPAAQPELRDLARRALSDSLLDQPLSDSLSQREELET